MSEFQYYIGVIYIYLFDLKPTSITLTETNDYLFAFWKRPLKIVAAIAFGYARLFL